MGVPITFLFNWNSNQFDIIWIAAGNAIKDTPKEICTEIGYTKVSNDRGGVAVVYHIRKYPRLLIRRKIPC